ncbi:MAG TPA: SGNH/GDSL hydrolase family protein [Ktedonobacteraceae bacterium]|nr:SGNH/GDSL hydrolase family protein [Ktedonobacteraceae bacterium]
MSGLLKHWRIVAPVILICSLLLTVVPSAMAASVGHGASPSSSKEYYLALGDSLAFGFQPNLDFRHGYVDDLSKYLVAHDDEFQPVANMACNGETSTTMLNGKCPYPSIRKYPYKGAQFEAALDYLHQHAGHVALVTLDIGANDTKNDINLQTCKIEKQKFATDLATLDKNLTHTILPQLEAALTINGQATGQLIVMNYYDPFQNICSDTVPFTEELNQHLGNDVGDYGTFVNVFHAFGGAKVPNPNICSYTWMCQKVPDIHATDLGYRVIEDVFEDALQSEILA